MHPLDKNLILGVGSENGNVKLSVFDVSDPTLPKEVAKYSLNEFWTEVSSNHHAFLFDANNKIFFMPGGNSGYIFSYRESSLTLKKVIPDLSAKRAVYIENFLYVLGEGRIVVIDENNFEEVSTFDL